MTCVLLASFSARYAVVDDTRKQHLVREGFLDGLSRDSYWFSKKITPDEDVIDYWVQQVFDHFIISHQGHIEDAERRATYSFNPRNRADERYLPGYVGGMKALCAILRMERGATETPTGIASDQARLAKEDRTLGYADDFESRLDALRQIDNQRDRQNAAEQEGRELDDLARRLGLYD